MHGGKIPICDTARISTAAKAEICNNKKEVYAFLCEKLKTLPPIASCQIPTTKKKAQNIANKKKSRNLIKIEQKSNPEYGQNINPISRLIQIQQAKKEKEPVYTLIAERGMPRRREFVMQVGLISFFA